jgi:excisionase family DNA binding protein
MIKPQIEPLLLTPREAAELLGVGRAAVYSLISRGAIPTLTVGRRKRIPRNHVETWITAQSSLPVAAAPFSGGAVESADIQPAMNGPVNPRRTTSRKAQRRAHSRHE